MDVKSNEKRLLSGVKPLVGEGTISGGRNTAVAVIPAALLADAPCTIENTPDIDDVHALQEIVTVLGAKVDYIPGQRMIIDPRNIKNCKVPYKLSTRLRASYYLIGALLGRFLQAEVAYPGGCEIGSRPMDQHIKGFVALGATLNERGGVVVAKAQ